MAGQTVVVSVLADTRRFRSAMQQLTGQTGIGRIGNEFRRSTGMMVNGLKRATRYVGILGAVIAGLAIKGGIDRLLDIESAEAKLRGLGHSAETVEQIMKDALASVKGTAFGLGEAATIATGAVAAGIKPGKELEAVLRLVADSATIANIPLDAMGDIFNKIAAGNRLTMREVNQLQNRGIPILQMLAEQYGVTTLEARAMVESGQIDFAAFRDAMEANVGGAALESGNTTRGAFNNMRHALARVGENLLRHVFPLFRDFFQGVIAFLDPIEDRAGEVGEAFAAWVEDVIPKVRSAIEGRLIPAWEALSSFYTNTLVPALRDVRNWMREHEEQIDKIKDALGPAIAIVFGITGAFTALSTVFAVLRFVTPIGIIVALTTALVGAWQNSETFRDIVTNVWETVGNVISFTWENVIKPTLEFFSNVWTEVLLPTINTFSDRWGEIWESVQNILTLAWNLISTIFGDIASGLNENEGGWEGWQGTVEDVVGTVTSILEELVRFIEEKLGEMTEWWDEHGEEVVRIVTIAWNVIKGIVTIALGVIHGLLLIFFGITEKDSETFWEGMGTIWQAGVDGLDTITGKHHQDQELGWGSSFRDIQLQTEGFWGFMEGIYRIVLGDMIDNMRAWVDDWKVAWDTAYNAIRDWWRDKAQPFLASIPDRVWNFLKGIPGMLWDLGKDAINGLKDGMLSVLDSPKEWFKSIGNKIVQGVKDFFGITSPSRLFAGLGTNLIQGFVKGMITSGSGLTNMVGKVFGGMPGALAHLVSKGAVAFSSLPGKAWDALMSVGHFFKSMFGDTVADVGGAFGFPLARGTYRIGSPFGQRGSGFHSGWDFPASTGTPVFAPMAGILSNVDLGNRSYGKYANIAAGAWRFIGAHLSAFARGAGPVRAGDLIGFVGSTGRSTGPHLHAEFRHGGRPVNPRNLLGFARGGFPQSGSFAWVGENGPELVRFRTPAQVYNNRQSQNMMSPEVDVRVFIGERELTDIVDVQIEEHSRDVRRRVRSGAGQFR